MRKALQAILLPAAISSLALTAPLDAFYDVTLPHIELLGEFVFLRRARIHSHSIAVDKTKRQCCTVNDLTHVTTCCPNFEVMDTKDLVRNFSFEPGYRVGITVDFDPKDSLEARFMTVEEWEGKKTVYGNDNTVYFPFDNTRYTNNFYHARKAKGRYESKLLDSELNYWRHLTPRRMNYFSVSTIAGFRYSEIKELFKITYYKERDHAVEVQKSFYRISTKNYLYGLQVGADLQWNPLRCLSWETIVKAGIMADDASQKTFLGDRDNEKVLRSFHSHRWNATWLAEALLSVAYQPLNYFNMHFGYQYLYYSGVALAPEQISKRTSPHAGQRVYIKGDPMYHGLFAGVVFSY